MASGAPRSKGAGGVDRLGHNVKSAFLEHAASHAPEPGGGRRR